MGLLATSSPAFAQTLRLGPINLNVGATAGFEYTDNANSSETDRKPDLRLTVGPTLSGGITLPISLRGGEKLTIQTSFSYTYKMSLIEDPTESFGSPISASLVLPIAVERWTILVSDSFSFSNEPLETTFAFNQGKASRYSNVAALSATRQLGRFAVTLAGQRSDAINPDDPVADTTTYQFSFTPAFYFRENYSIFLRNTVSFDELADKTQPSSTGFSSEIGLSGQITPQLVGSVSLGYSHSTIDGVGTNSESNVDGISSTIALSYAHPLRPNTSHSLSFFRSPGVSALLKNTALTETTGITYTISHRLSRHITLSPSLTYTHLEAIGGTSDEKTDIVQVGIGLGRSFTRHLSGSVSYRFQLRDSNLAGGSYYVNTVNANLSYTF
jgi:hypothetical protein